MDVETIEINDLHEDPANVRVHPEKNIAAIKASLARFGQVKPVVIDAANIVRAGNGTLRAARELAWTHIKCIRTKLAGSEATAYGLADNRTAETSEWDYEGVSAMLKALQSEGTDITTLGWDTSEIEAIANMSIQGLGGEFSGSGSDIDPDAVPEPPDAAITQPGDLWILGDHRLLCGDSVKAEDVDRLLDGARIQLVNTDPPYNVKVEPRSNNAIAAGNSSFPASDAHKGRTHHQAFDVARQGEKKSTGQMRAKDRPLINDFVSDAEFDRLLRAWFGNIARVLEPGRAFYIWGGYANCGNYPPVLKECELYFAQAVIWVKEHPVLTRKDFMGNHEWCFYGWREGAAHYFNPEIHNATDVWSVKKVNPQSMVHLTEKPVELAVRAMTYSSNPGENVLDLFGGSGSTLIGAERTGRRAYLMELDQLYCDVIVKRFEEYSGKKANRIAMVNA